jgi:hypothetical protein
LYLILLFIFSSGQICKRNKRKVSLVYHIPRWSEEEDNEAEVVAAAVADAAEAAAGATEVVAGAADEAVAEVAAEEVEEAGRAEGAAAAETRAAAPERVPSGGAWLRAAVWRPRRTCSTSRRSKVRVRDLISGFETEKLLRFNRAS